MSSFLVNAPGGFVPAGAVAFADSDGEAVYVDPNNPLPAAERPWQGAVPVTADTDQTPRRGIALIANAAGAAALKLADDSLIVVPVDPGLTILPFAVKTIHSSGTTAVLTAYNLI